jgi:hypothetical protein
MKTAILCVVCGTLTFLVMLGVQLGTEQPPPFEQENSVADATKKTARFPEDLARAVRGAPIPEAAAFAKSTDPHPTAVLDRSGKLHPWHERQPTGWRAESVEATELILILGQERRTQVQLITYSNGAPPVRRYRYELDARVVQARTGKTVAGKRFVSEARPIRSMEQWELTELGDPIECADVNQWLRETATRIALETIEEN